MRLETGLAPESFKAQWGYSIREKRCEYLGVDRARCPVARRDWAAVQLILLADQSCMLNVGAVSAFSKHGAWPQLRVSVDSPFERKAIVQIVGYVEDDDRLLRTDMLLNSAGAEMPAGRLACVYIEVPVPDDAPAGAHIAPIRVYMTPGFGDERLVAEHRLEVCVYPALLPDKERRFKLGLWQHPCNIARKHEVPPFSDAHFSVLEHYARSLAELGQTSVCVVASDMPWAGQSAIKVPYYPSDLYEYSPIRVFRGRDGAFGYDFSAMERYIRLFEKHGIDGDIELVGLCGVWTEEGYVPDVSDYPEPLRIRYLDRADGCYKYMREGADIRAYIRALESLFVEKGWIDRVRIGADEPADVERYRRIRDAVHEAAPRFQFKAAIGHVEFMRDFKDDISDFVPHLSTVCKYWQDVKALKERGKNGMYWYVCCGPLRPNTFIVSPLLESRLIPILTSWMGLDGFLRWNYTVWPEDPRNRISYRYPIWPAGDTNFVYPANDGRPLLTLRYKALRRGADDFELLEMLRAKGDLKTLEQAFAHVIRVDSPPELDPDLELAAERMYSLDERDYRDMREQVLKALCR